MNYIIKKEGINYQVAHLTGSYYELDGRKYGPESYLVMNLPNEKYYKAMTPEEFLQFFDFKRFRIESDQKRIGE